MPSNQVEHDRVNVAQGGFTSSGYDHEWQSTAGWLTPSENDLTQWDANLVFLPSSLLFSVSSRYKKQKNRMLWSEDSNDDRQRDEGHPSSDTNCWEWARPHVRKRSHNNLFRRKNLRMGDMKQKTHREREREAQRISIFINRQQLQQMNNQPLQKVTKSHYIVTHLGQLPFMLFTSMARTWAIQEDSVNTSIIHWYSTGMPVQPLPT